jgi:hypothetical protein
LLAHEPIAKKAAASNSEANKTTENRIARFLNNQSSPSRFKTRRCVREETAGT